MIKSTEEASPPEGVRLIKKYLDDVDIVNLALRFTPKAVLHYQSKNISLLATNHMFEPNEKPPFKWVHVSKTLADLYNDNQNVWNGLDPDDFIFSDQKEDYFLFIADMYKYNQKGAGYCP